MLVVRACLIMSRGGLDQQHSRNQKIARTKAHVLSLMKAVGVLLLHEELCIGSLCPLDMFSSKERHQSSYPEDQPTHGMMSRLAVIGLTRSCCDCAVDS